MSELLTFLENWTKFISSKVAKKWLDTTDKSMKAILARNGKGKGNLYKSIKSKMIIHKDSVELVISMPGYGKYVDEGRRPGKQPPLKSIQKWCKSKGIKQQFAFPIAKKIGERGIKGIHFTTPAHNVKSLLNDIAKLTAEELGSAMKSDIENNTK